MIAQNGIRTALADDRIICFSDLLPTSSAALWPKSTAGSYMAVSCFLLDGGREKLLIDTGVAVNRNWLINQIVTCCEADGRLSLLMSRREPDAIINLPALAEKPGLQRVYCGGVISPLEFFEQVDKLSAARHVNALAHSDITWIAPDENLELGSLKLKVLRTPLAVLPKNHFYDYRTRTLFGSDSWGFAGQNHAGTLEVITSDDDRLSVERLADYLTYRFPWIRGANVDAVKASIRSIRANFEIERICSTYGAVLEGAALVDTVLERTIAAIDLASRREFVDPLAGHEVALSDVIRSSKSGTA